MNECPICLESCADEIVIKNKCGHSYCLSCQLKQKNCAHCRHALEPCDADAMHSVTVTTLTGQVLSVPVCLYKTRVSDICRVISMLWIPYPADSIRILYRGYMLSAFKTLRDCKYDANGQSGLNMILSLRGD